MLLSGIVVGLVLGLLLGGRIDRLIEVRLRLVGLIFLAVILRFGTEMAIRSRMPLVDELRLPLFALAFGALIYGLWVNRDRPGLIVAAAGAASNLLAIVANGGWMPVWGPALELAGFTPDDLVASFHRLLPDEIGVEFLLRAGIFGDIIPVPLPFITNVASVGDVFISAGLGLFVFGTLLAGGPRDDTRITGEAPVEPIPAPTGVRLQRPLAAALSRAAVRPETGIVPPDAYADAIALDRPVMLGGTSAGATSPSAYASPAGEAALPVPTVPPIVARIGQHPYVRLALDARFSAFWLGQVISLFGDRLHQVALGVLVYALTGSPLLTGLTFVAATLPNLLLGPIAGTFVDRWDHKQVLVVSDLLRAALVLFLPIAALQDIRLVYPIVFAITAVSIFFRPAKAAVLPRIVREQDLLAANSATWTGEALADVAGYPLAGLFVAFLGASLPLAFWIDAASYLISALLILGLSIPPVIRAAVPVAGNAVRRFIAELGEGWRFLRRTRPLFHNTLVSALAQTSFGATIALTVVFARDSLDGNLIPYPQNYAALEAVLGVGNLVGGLAVGVIGARIGKGRMVVGGMLSIGLATVLLGLSSNVLLALVAAWVTGVANLVYIIPTQTIFGELTPPNLMGRVVAMRQTIVFGSLNGAMLLASGLAERIDAGLVIAAFGLLTVLAGVIAALLPAVRDS
ncbi:MAG TPA: MFS transporter [Candidatus Limnocylindrales bacterium]|nr:MFS transporter [Candidatus Limnocylindrales bacterium]